MMLFTTSSEAAILSIEQNMSYVYNGDMQAPSITLSVCGVIGLQINYEGTGATFYAVTSQAPKNIGTYKVTAVYISGGCIGQSATANFVITKLPVTLTASTNTKVYDGTISAAATPTITLGSLASGDVGTYSETYDTKSQGIGKTLTPNVISILDATSVSMVGNYSITYAIKTDGEITKKSITLTASTNTKVYDGTISAAATPTITLGSLASGDVGTYSETYDTKSQ
ncbi:MAG: YDG domain-containing protein, partial [Bacteroidetes bacterium]|nr:YDG domain-containing protein [Bacteroidota bacterium]